MFGNDRRWPAAALAGGLALAVWVGCGSGGPGVAGKTAAVVQETREHHDHAMAEEGHDHSAMDHGAMSATVPPGQPAKTLSPDALDAPAETSVQDAQRSAEMAEEMSGGGGHEGHGDHSGHGAQGGHAGHGTGTYRQTDAGREPMADHESHQHGEHGGHGDEDATAGYVCPMHPEVTSDTPGKCPKCGMDLVKKEKKE
jgi:Heavy metal binding domain